MARADFAGDLAQRLAVDVRRQADHALHVVALHLAQRRSRSFTFATSPSSGCGLAALSSPAAVPRPRWTPCRSAESRPGSETRCRSPDRASSSGSTNRLDDVAATSDLRDVRHCQAELAGALAIDVDVQRRIVQRLRVLQVAQRRQSSPARVDTFSAKARLAAMLGPCTATSIGVGEPKLITWLTMSPASNEIVHSGRARGEASRAVAPSVLRRDQRGRASAPPAAPLRAGRWSTGKSC